MGSKRTPKCNYPSLKGGGWVTPAQYVTEHLCILKAEGDLPEKFWTLKEWANFYRWQIKYANKLLETYDAEVLAKALRDKRLRGLQSLSDRAAWKWKKVFDEYQKNHITVVADGKEIHNVDTTEKPRPTLGRKSPLKRLKDLDG